jgi:SAM-dependent methyltransferase
MKDDIEHSRLVAKRYLDVAYDEEIKPLGNYPNLLTKWIANHVFIKQGRILDVGSGRGEHLNGFYELGYGVAGLDICQAAVDSCPDFDVRVADLAHEPLPYQADSFDYVFSKSVIEHTLQPAVMFEKIKEALKPGGKAVIMTPSWIHTYKIFYMEYTHVKPFTRQSLHDAMKIAGFENVEVDYFYQLPFLWEHPWLKPFIKTLGCIPLPYKPVNNVPWPEGLNKLIRFSQDVMLIGIGEKPIK